jgi:hypothetical protein
VLNEFYRVAFRRKIYVTIEQLQSDPDDWLREYNEVRPHQGRWCYGKTPLQTFVDSPALAREKMLARPRYPRMALQTDDHAWLRNLAVAHATA